MNQQMSSALAQVDNTPVVLVGKNETDLVESRELRDSLVEHEAVFEDERVKALGAFLLPKNFGATTEQVSNYFEIPIGTLKSTISEHIEELSENGYMIYEKDDLKFLKGELGNPTSLKFASSLGVMSRRAILNVAMLLRDSQVAKTIRSVLLDTTENKTVVKEIIKEQVPSVRLDENLKEKEIEAKLMNAKTRQANMFLKIANMVNIPEYTQICCSKATEILNNGTSLIPLPKAERKTYSAKEIGDKLGITANKVGSIANAHNLKTDQFGLYVWDKSKYSNKQVQSFRYYEEVIPEISKFIKEA